MDFMVCAYGEPSEAKFIPFIEKYVAGVELQNYDRKGVLSDKAWFDVLEQHRAIIRKLPGRLAIHGPFAGIDVSYKDHLLREAVRKRMDMTYEMVQELKPDTLVLHTGCSEEMVKLNLADSWLEKAEEFWRNEIKRYEACKTRIVLENIIEQQPDAMIELADRIESDFFGLCLDTGHAHVCSSFPPALWVQKMGSRLKHVHLHDNRGTKDDHLPVGHGTIHFDSFFDALHTWAPDATVSLEVIDNPEVVIENVIYVTERYGTSPNEQL